MVLISEERSLINSIQLAPSKFSIINTLPVELWFSDSQPHGTIIAPQQGISQFGPYDVNTLDSNNHRKFNSVEVIVFYPKGNLLIRDKLRQLIDFLKEGYFEERGSPMGRGADVNFAGLKNEFQLKEVFFPDTGKFIEYEPGKLGNAIFDNDITAIDILGRGNVPIAIVGGSTHRSVSINKQHYIEAKKSLTRWNLPCQYCSLYEIETGSLGILSQVDSDNPFGYSLWNLALNIYGKVGGTAWVVRQKISENESKLIDLTIGIRFVMAPKQGGQELGFTDKKYYVGHITVLDSFGRLVGAVSSRPIALPFEELMSRGMRIPTDTMILLLETVLSRAVNDERIKRIIETKSSLNISIHRMAKFYPEEVSGIDAAINSIFSSKKVAVGLIGIVNDPSVLAFKASTQSKMKPGTSVKLNDNSALIYTKASTRAFYVYPIVAVCQNLGHTECCFNNVEEICNHILDISALHWQTVAQRSVRLPASLEFAEDIAHMAANQIVPETGSWLWRTLWFI